MIRFLFALGMVVMAALPAQASLIGTQVRASSVPVAFGFDQFNQTPVTVTEPGAEFVFTAPSGDTFTIDFRGNSVVFSLASTLNGDLGSALAVTIDFLTPGLVIAAALDGTPSWPLSAGPSLVGDRLTFTAADFATRAGQTYSVTVLLTTGTTGTPGTAVPVPGALALFGVALLGLAAVARRRG